MYCAVFIGYWEIDIMECAGYESAVLEYTSTDVSSVKMTVPECTISKITRHHIDVMNLTLDKTYSICVEIFIASCILMSICEEKFTCNGSMFRKYLLVVRKIFHSVFILHIPTPSSIFSFVRSLWSEQRWYLLRVLRVQACSIQRVSEPYRLLPDDEVSFLREMLDWDRLLFFLRASSPCLTCSSTSCRERLTYPSCYPSCHLASSGNSWVVYVRLVSHLIVRLYRSSYRHIDHRLYHVMYRAWLQDRMLRWWVVLLLRYGVLHPKCTNHLCCRHFLMCLLFEESFSYWI
jgi:hypothetical protein